MRFTNTTISREVRCKISGEILGWMVGNEKPARDDMLCLKSPYTIGASMVLRVYRADANGNRLQGFKQIELTWGLNCPDSQFNVWVLFASPDDRETLRRLPYYFERARVYEVTAKRSPANRRRPVARRKSGKGKAKQARAAKTQRKGRRRR